MAEAPLVYPRSIPTQVRPGESSSSSIRDFDSFGTKVVDYLKIKVYRSAEGNPYSYMGGQGSSTEGALYKTIYLYLPQGLKEEYGAQYNRTALGAGGLGVMKAAGTLAGTGDKSEALTNIVQSTAGAMKPEAVMNAVAAAVGTVNSAVGLGTNVDANTLAALTTKKIFNPYEETTFRGSNYRSHQFNFKCQPRNAKESEELYKIIHCLRLAMLPGMNDGSDDDFITSSGFNEGVAGLLGSSAETMGGSGRWLTIPDYFRIEVIRVEGKPSESGDLEVTSGQPNALKRIMRFPVKMVLTNMSIDLTPDGPYNSLKDALDSSIDYGPAAFNLSLSFDETAFLTKQSFSGM